jgi:hypothetical protein
MKNRESQDFLAQFAASRKAFDLWPAWMRESATVAAATLPRQDSGTSKDSRAAAASNQIRARKLTQG